MVKEKISTDYKDEDEKFRLHFSRCAICQPLRINVPQDHSIFSRFAVGRISIETDRICFTNLLLLFTAVNFVGTLLQEIKVDCDIDDRASIAITKKGKVWEVSGIGGKRFQH